MNEQQLLVEQLLERYGLAGASATPLHSYNNHVYCVETADQQRYSLRICGFPQMKRRTMEDEMTWLAFVAQRNPRLAPKPIANVQGELVTSITTAKGERLSCLFAWVEGMVLRDPLTPTVLHKMGRSVAALHNIAREFPFSDASSDFRNGYRYDQSLMVSHRDWIAKRRDAIGAQRVVLLDRAIDYVVAAMDRISTTHTNYGVIHADLSFGNLLVQDGEIYIIDFEQLGRGHFLYDLAVLHAELANDSTNFATLWASFVAGYEEVAPLPFREASELAPFTVATYLNFLDWVYNTANPTVLAAKAAMVPATYESIQQWVD